jgi:hypothetical protein
MVLTDRRLLIFETGRTPNPRQLLAAYPTDDIEVVSVAPDRFHSVRFVLELPEVGRVPFIAGRRDQDDLEVLIERLGGAPS